MNYYPQYYNAQPQMQVDNRNYFTWIQGGVNTAKAYTLQNGQVDAYLMDTDEPYLFYKAMIDGKPVTKVYELVERNLDEINAPESSAVQTNYLTKEDLASMNFATKSDLSDFLKELQSIKDEILDIQTAPDETTPKRRNSK